MERRAVDMTGKPARRAFSTRAHLIVLTTFLLAPLIVAATALAIGFSMKERDRYQSEALEVAARVSASVDRQMLSLQDGLRLLRATLDQAGARAPEVRDALADTADILGTRVVLQDDTAILLDSRTVRRPGPPPETLPAIDGPMGFLGLRTDTSGSGPVVGIKIPIRTTAPGGLALVMEIPAARITGVIAAENLPTDWTGAVLDETFVIVARSRQNDRFVGTQATDDLRRRATGDGGVWQGITKEGTPVLSAYARSAVTGWRVAVGVPVAAVEKPLTQALVLLGTAALGGLAVALAAASWYGGRISKAMTDLADTAVALGQSAPLRAPAETTNSEINLIGKALSGAAAELARRADARNRAEEALAAANARLQRVLDHSPVGIVEVDADGHIAFANEAACRLLRLSSGTAEGRRYDAPAWGNATVDGRPLAVADLPVSRALTGETVTAFEQSIMDPRDGTRRILSVNAIPVVEDGAIAGVLAVFDDISKRHEVELHQRLLINELNHRVKNTLATVNSIAAQSLRSTTDTEAARDAFTGRIVALAQAHDVLTRERWEGADLTAVVDGAVAPHGADRFDVAGVPVRLGPQTALSFAMALHELATNAVKYGALCVPDGRVAIAWTLAERPEGRFLLFRWSEHGGPTVTPPTRRGFGSRLIEQGLSRELGGAVRILFEPDGLVCTIDAPLPGDDREA
ncbi:HWE histidine kinase domain-containing protein [Mongoliimonas terrestris]|uniref:HWE histidine kinase domain-containing protein n=1 Tax=Mongoliimonas terrestris TaxID=1709001 RepID=UPI0009498EF3|nr:HWE histidine kinase domain-containing protein [Mongoliimonas terrestris]